MPASHNRNFTALVMLAAVFTAAAWEYTPAERIPLQISEPQQASLQGSEAGSRRVFTTTFMQSEQPIRENGAWHHLGSSWATVRSFDHHAVGTQTGTKRYDDSYAYLDGFPPDQIARATVWIDQRAQGDFQEFELLLRWSDSNDLARGYECNLAWNGSYAQIVRWNGPFANFTYVANQSKFPPGLMPPQSGDVLTATIRGGTISLYLNKNDGKGDQLLVRGNDTTFKDGNPGMGFYIEGQHDPAAFGFSRFAAWAE